MQYVSFLGIGVQELVIVLVIVLVLFGGKNIPEIAKNVGKTVREVRKNFDDEVDGTNEKTAKTTKSADSNE